MKELAEVMLLMIHLYAQVLHSMAHSGSKSASCIVREWNPRSSKPQLHFLETALQTS